MSRLSRVLVVAVVALGVAAPSAAAVPGKELGDTLGAMWKNVLETPTPQNPFGGGGPLCVDLGGVVAPFGGTRGQLDHVHREARYEGVCRRVVG